MAQLDILEPKDPHAILDYRIDYSRWLKNGDTIQSSTWPTVPSGITKVSDSFDTTSTTVWVSGGTAGASYLLTNRIVTVGGRTQDRTITIRVKDL